MHEKYELKRTLFRSIMNKKCEKSPFIGSKSKQASYNDDDDDDEDDDDDDYDDRMEAEGRLSGRRP